MIESVFFASYGNKMFTEKEETENEKDEKKKRKEINTRRTILIYTFSPLLFFAPDRYLRQVRFLNWRDIDKKPEDWQEFVHTLEKPWTDFTLYASFILRNLC